MVRELQEMRATDLNISHFYDFATERALATYERETEHFIRELCDYFRRCD